MATLKRPIIDRSGTIEAQAALAKGIAELQATVLRESERANEVRRAIGDATKRLRQNARRYADASAGLEPDAGALWQMTNSGEMGGPPRLVLLRGGAGDEGRVGLPTEVWSRHSGPESAGPAAGSGKTQIAADLSFVPRDDRRGRSEPVCEDTSFQGIVLLRIVSSGSARAMVEFLNAVWQQPAFRVHQFNGGQAGKVTEVSVELRQPLTLDEAFASLPSVAATRIDRRFPDAPVIDITLADRPVAAVS